jgi:alpha-1,3-rhamnosyl/mannosyltransferase
VDPGDAEGFAGAMEQAAFDDEVRARLIAAGRQQASNFTWERAARATLGLYRQVRP